MLVVPKGQGRAAQATKVSTQGRFWHPRLLHGISLHKEKQISSSRASPGEQTRTSQGGKHQLENKTRALQPAPSSRDPPKPPQGLPLGSSKPPDQPTAPTGCPTIGFNQRAPRGAEVAVTTVTHLARAQHGDKGPPRTCFVLGAVQHPENTPGWAQETKKTPILNLIFGAPTCFFKKITPNPFRQPQQQNKLGRVPGGDGAAAGQCLSSARSPTKSEPPTTPSHQGFEEAASIVWLETWPNRRQPLPGTTGC